VHLTVVESAGDGHVVHVAVHHTCHLRDMEMESEKQKQNSDWIHKINNNHGISIIKSYLYTNKEEKNIYSLKIEFVFI
jgi:hypothetical protein